MTRNLSTLLGLAILGSACASPNTTVFGADAGTIAREAQNPVSKLTRVGLQSNFNGGYGVDDDLQYVGNIQSTIPFALDDDFNVVNELSLPVISQPEVGPVDSETGIGNLEWTAWMALDVDTTGTFAFGPVLVSPTNTDEALGPDSFAAGVALVAMRKTGDWVVGLQYRGVWNIPGDADDEITETRIQPLINYNLDDGWYWTSTPTLVNNKEARSGESWTVPLGGGIGRVVQFGAQPVNFTLQGFWNVDNPEETGGEWSIVFDVEMLYTKRGYRSWKKPKAPN